MQYVELCGSELRPVVHITDEENRVIREFEYLRPTCTNKKRQKYLDNLIAVGSSKR